MARATARQVLQCGPFKGVRTTIEPYDDAEDWLVDLINGYIPDPQGKSAVFSRPGFSLLNSGSAVFSSGAPFRGQGIYTHTTLDGTSYNFCVWGGKLYRVNTALTSFTDVTPAAPIGVDSGITTRVKFVSLADSLIISDGVNRPWVASNLSSTPVTGTNIDYDGANVAWCAQDICAWGGALIAILKTVNSVYRQTDISWSQPGTPATGWQQTNYDNNWTLQQTGSSPLYALAPTNGPLYYLRQRAIGAISGAIGPNLSSTATHDAVSFNVGTQAPQSVQLFGNYVYFTDTLGRPWRLAIGGVPEPIWLSMRAIVDTTTTAFPAVTKVVTTSAFEPTLNLYLVAIWSPTPTNQAAAIEMYAFDARTGAYMGRWQIGGGTGTSIDSIGTFLDSNGRATLIVQGSKVAAPATDGFMWALNSLSSVSTYLETQSLIRLTTQDGRELTAQGATTVFTDNGVVPLIEATTPRLGYDADVVWNTDKCVVVSGAPTSVDVTMITPSTSGTLQGTPTAAGSQDGTYRLVVGTTAVGRGVQVVVRPTTASTQWTLDHVQVIAVPSSARPEDY